MCGFLQIPKPRYQASRLAGREGMVVRSCNLEIGTKTGKADCKMFDCGFGYLPLGVALRRLLDQGPPVLAADVKSS